MKEFLLIIDVGHICYSIISYKRYIKSSETIMIRICYYCGLFVYLLLLVIDLRLDSMIVAALDKETMNIMWLGNWEIPILLFMFQFSKAKKDLEVFFYKEIKYSNVPRLPPYFRNSHSDQRDIDCLILSGHINSQTLT